MKRDKRWFIFFLIAGILLIASTGHSDNKQAHRILKVTVTDINGDMLTYKTEEGTTRNVALKVVEQFEKIENVKKGDQLVMEFDEGNQLIRINRPDRATISGEILKFDAAGKKVTVKLKDGSTETYTVIPPVVSKMSGLPEGAMVALDIDAKNNFVKDFERIR
jgi:hypothetical protein